MTETAAAIIFFVLLGMSFGIVMVIRQLESIGGQIDRAVEHLSEMRVLLKNSNAKLSSIEFYTERMPKTPRDE